MTGLPSFEYPLNSLRINLCSTSAAAKTEAFTYTVSVRTVEDLPFFLIGEREEREDPQFYLMGEREGSGRPTILSHGERVGSGISAHFISLGGGWRVEDLPFF